MHSVNLNLSPSGWRKHFTWPVFQDVEGYLKLGRQSRMTYSIAAIFIFARFMKDILGVTSFFVEKTLQ